MGHRTPAEVRYPPINSKPPRLMPRQLLASPRPRPRRVATPVPDERTCSDAVRPIAIPSSAPRRRSLAAAGRIPRPPEPREQREIASPGTWLQSPSARGGRIPSLLKPCAGSFLALTRTSIAAPNLCWILPYSIVGQFTRCCLSTRSGHARADLIGDRTRRSGNSRISRVYRGQGPTPMPKGHAAGGRGRKCFFHPFLAPLFVALALRVRNGTIPFPAWVPCM